MLANSKYFSIICIINKEIICFQPLHFPQVFDKMHVRPSDKHSSRIPRARQALFALL